jgi:hypothetical protein
MNEAPLCDWHLTPMEWNEVTWRLPDGVEELQYWARCSQLNCERQYNHKVGYCNLIGGRIDGPRARHLCQTQACNDAGICMGLVENDADTRTWYCFVCKKLGEYHSSK